MFAAAAQYDKLDELLLHSRDEEERRRQAMQRTKGEAASAMDNFFQGVRGPAGQRRRGSVLSSATAQQAAEQAAASPFAKFRQNTAIGPDPAFL